MKKLLGFLFGGKKEAAMPFLPAAGQEILNPRGSFQLFARREDDSTLQDLQVCSASWDASKGLQVLWDGRKQHWKGRIQSAFREIWPQVLGFFQQQNVEVASCGNCRYFHMPEKLSRGTSGFLGYCLWGRQSKAQLQSDDCVDLLSLCNRFEPASVEARTAVFKDWLGRRSA